MKKICLLICAVLLLSGCATLQNQQKLTWYMSREAKIQYYQEQIDHYEFLIEQEKKKISEKEK